MQRPGMANLPTLFTSLQPSSASAPITLVTSRLLRLSVDATLSAMLDFDIALTPAAPAFIAFMAFIDVFGNIAQEGCNEGRRGRNAE